MTRRGIQAFRAFALHLTVLGALLCALPPSVGRAHAESVTIEDVRLGRPGDRWLDTLTFERLEQATENEQHGYAVTYRIAGHGAVRLFWPRRSIDLADESPHYRLVAMRLRRGRLWYPAIITAHSLPAVHRGILALEAAYGRYARSEIAVYEALAGIASLGAMGPTPRGVPLRSGRASSGRVSASSGASSKPPAGGSGGASGGVGSTAGTVAASSTAVVTRSVKASRRALARSLINAGHKRPPESAAHHIVAGGAKLARPAREVLQKFGIGINEASNGVFLPATLKSANPTGAAVHSTLHTTKYYMKVNAMLRFVTTKADVLRALDDIRVALKAGGL